MSEIQKMQSQYPNAKANSHNVVQGQSPKPRVQRTRFKVVRSMDASQRFDLLLPQTSSHLGAAYIVKTVLELLEAFSSCQNSGLVDWMFLRAAFKQSSDIFIISLPQSLALSQSTGGGESGGNSAVCVSNRSAFSSATVNPSGSGSSAALMTLFDLSVQ